MLSVRYIVLLGLLLIALLSSMFEMKTALDEADFVRFFVWTCAASVIAGIPVSL